MYILFLFYLTIIGLYYVTVVVSSCLIISLLGILNTQRLLIMLHIILHLHSRVGPPGSSEIPSINPPASNKIHLSISLACSSQVHTALVTQPVLRHIPALVIKSNGCKDLSISDRKMPVGNHLSSLFFIKRIHQHNLS